MRPQIKLRIFTLIACLACSVVPFAQSAAPQSGAAAPQVLDRVVAVVNGDVLLASDVEEEVRFAAFEPFSEPPGGNPRAAALDRLIDRALIEQQMRNQPGVPRISDDQVNTQLTQLRKGLPECAKYACYTDKGWETFCRLHGFTPRQVFEHWRLRMKLLAFIEQRFRTGIRISQKQIEDYYNSDFVPQFRQKHLIAPPLSQVKARIEEILLQQRVNALLGDWLKSLREEGSVQIIDPSLITPPEGGTESKT